MTKDNKYNLTVILMLLASITLIALSLPSDTAHMGTMLSHEVGKPWRNPTLIAPFDIPHEYDEATKQHITDSVDAHYAHFYIYNTQLGDNQIALLNKALSNQPGLTAAVRYKVINTLEQLYQDGIIDTDAFENIQAGRMPYVRIRDNSGDGNTDVVQTSTQRMHSVKQAYELLDSALAGSPQRDIVLQVGLNNYLEPNLVIDEQEDKKWYTDALKTALTPPSIPAVQMGEAIIFTGNVVTAEKDAIIRTYQQMLANNEKKRSGSENNTLLGQIVIVTLLMMVFYAYVKLMRPRIFRDMRRMSFLIVFTTLMVVAVLWIVKFRPNYLFLIPFAIVPIIVSNFYDARTSFFIHLVVLLVCSLVAREQAAFIIMQFLAGSIAIASMQELTRRSQLVRCAVLIFIAYCVSYVALELLRGIDLENIDWHYFMYFAVNCVVLSFAYMGVFLVEKLFGFTSTMTLVELNDITSPLLRQLSENCPGTFQHALQVANIASEAAVKIGASTQLVRAGALYHDIGKIENPAFFTENQSGVNPHDALAPEQSAHIVIQHVTDGVKMAEKARLPQVVKDMILQHHGKGLTKYFYMQACKAHPNGTVETAPYSYPGPNPQSREAAIVMMADSCEAAAKSLNDYSEESIRAMVDRIVDSQIADGLLREAPISFSDVETVKQIFTERLKSFYHRRISYPTDVNPKESDSSKEVKNPE